MLFFFIYCSFASSYFTKTDVLLQISSEEINQNLLKWQIYQTLKKVKLLVLVWQATKPAELFGVAKSIVSIVMTAFEKEGKKPPHGSKTLEQSESCRTRTQIVMNVSQEYSTENYSRT